MARPLFVYGTLRDDDVVIAVLGRPVAAFGPVAAHATDHVARRVAGQVYPGLAAAPGETAPGLLLTALAAGDLARLDAFEGDGYTRQPLTVQTAAGPVEADVYRPTGALPLSAEGWTLEGWRETGKAVFLARYRGFQA